MTLPVAPSSQVLDGSASTSVSLGQQRKQKARQGTQTGQKYIVSTVTELLEVETCFS